MIQETVRRGGNADLDGKDYASERSASVCVDEVLRFARDDGAALVQPRRLTAWNRFANIDYPCRAALNRQPVTTTKNCNISSKPRPRFSPKRVSSHLGARYFARDQNEPVGPVLLFHHQRRIAVSDPRALLCNLAGALGARRRSAIKMCARAFACLPRII